MSQCVKGSFASGQSVQIGEASDVLVVPTGFTAGKLTTTGLDANNTIKTQKSTDNGITWADQVTFNADQTNTAVVFADKEQWRLVHVAGQALKTIGYELSAQS